jgi:hypothetical protein
MRVRVKLPELQKDSYLELTREELLFLLAATGSISGSPSGPRGLADSASEKIGKFLNSHWSMARAELGIALRGNIMASLSDGGQRRGERSNVL